MSRRLVLMIGMALVSALVIAGCGGDDDGGDTTTADAPEATVEEAPAPPPEPDPPPTAADPGLPAYTAGFLNGTKLNAAPIPQDPGAPHGEVKNVYVNQDRDTIAPGGNQAFPYPDGTVVVKTGSRGGDDAAIVAAMQKIQGADPEHGDWVFEEFSRTSADEEYTPLASGSSCWGCHAGANDSDWVFTRLQ